MKSQSKKTVVAKEFFSQADRIVIHDPPMADRIRRIYMKRSNVTTPKALATIVRELLTEYISQLERHDPSAPTQAV